MLSLTQTLWSYHEPDQNDLEQALRLYPHLSPLVLKILLKRGIKVDRIDSFLDPKLKEELPDPFHLKDMDKAVHRLADAVEKQQSIWVFGDYDVDGATSSALWVIFFRTLGIEISYYIPHREKEGYGPSIAAMRYLKDKGAQVVITVDCGASAFEALEEARTIGLDVIVLDHHLGQDHLPQAVAVVNPNRADESSPHTYLAAVGVSFLTAIALRKTLRERGWFERLKKKEPLLLDLLDLVALGTVADVMPLVGLNRAFVRQGLQVMQATSHPGLQALKQVSRLTENVEAYHLGFLLGPRINAAGRIDDAFLGTHLLTTQNEAEARVLAERLDVLNTERQIIEAQVLQEAHALVDETASIICLAAPHWPVGVVGLVASRLKERYHKPALVLSWQEDGTAKGSGRSIGSVHLGQLIQDAVDIGLLLKGGGHAMAVGIQLGKHQWEPFQAFLKDALKEVDMRRSLTIDAALHLGALTPEILRILDALGPFGAGNPKPKIMIPHIRITHTMVMAQHHLRCTLEAENGARLQGVAFRVIGTPLGDALQDATDGLFDVVGSPSLNTWNGRTSVQLLIEDIAKNKGSLADI